MRNHLLAQWAAVLAAPVAWSVALAVLYSRTEEVCAGGSRAVLVSVAAVCFVVAAAPAPLAWRTRRRIEAGSQAAERLRFMLGLAAGASVIFGLVLLLSMVPIFLLSPCRT